MGHAATKGTEWVQALPPARRNASVWPWFRRADDGCQVQIKLAIQRLRTLQEKKLAMAKKSRREIADLLLKDRVETARLRVEGLIGDDIYVELLELLEVGQASVCVGSPGQELISPSYTRRSCRLGSTSSTYRRGSFSTLCMDDVADLE